MGNEIITAGSSNSAAIGMSEAIAAKEALRKAGEVIKNMIDRLTNTPA